MNLRRVLMIYAISYVSVICEIFNEKEMGKKVRALSAYVKCVRSMVEKRHGSVPVFLEPQIAATASTWKLMDKVSEELADTPLLDYEVGSSGQNKRVLNPLLAQYDRITRTLTSQLDALGLTLYATPKGSDGDAPGDDSQFLSLLSELRSQN